MLIESALVFAPASLEPRWKWSTLTLISAAIWAITRGSMFETAATALVVANGIMYRVISVRRDPKSLLPETASDWYWHVFIPVLAVVLYRIKPCTHIGSWDFTIPVAFATIYAALLLSGRLTHYEAFQNAKPPVKVVFITMYFTLVILSVYLLKR